MKKVFAIISSLLLTTSVFSQGVETFENFTLAPESYDNGSSQSGDFILSSGLTLSNYYDTAWSSWSGFTLSNITDNTTPGWGNQYSAFPGGGADSSENYAVFYLMGEMSVQTGTVIAGFDVSNSTYAGISMRDGDPFAKQFGSPFDANGLLDGTNGEDFFRLWVICEDHNQQQKDSVEFYLADYRFQDSTLDYIIDDWQGIDLSTIPFNVGKVSFRLESSDNGSFGMNTPAYFVIDNVQTLILGGLVETTALQAKVYPNPTNGFFIVEGEGEVVKVFNDKGQIVLSEKHNNLTRVDTSFLPAGFYYVEVSSGEKVFRTKLVKE